MNAMKPKSNPRIVALDYLDWSVCAGGHHFTGCVVISDPFRKIELERKLSWKEAKALGETQEILWRRNFDRNTNRFETFDEMLRAAIVWCKENLGDDWLLQEHTSHGPHKPLSSSGKFRKIFHKLSVLAKNWDKVRDNQTEKEMSKYYRQWEKLTNVR